MDPNPSRELSAQWLNPTDILSLLLLIGGDVVQKAIAQLFGVSVRPMKSLPRIYLTPVAFSFGWVGYAVATLASVVGDKQLMPGIPDCPSIVINCKNGYRRKNCSWLLGRILRDGEMRVESEVERKEKAGAEAKTKVGATKSLDVEKSAGTEAVTPAAETTTVAAPETGEKRRLIYPHRHFRNRQRARPRN